MCEYTETCGRINPGRFWYNTAMERTFKYVLTGEEWLAWNQEDTRDRRQAQSDILTRAERMAMRAEFDFVAYYSPHEDHLGITTLRDV